ncbi:C39 family peptidase [Roseimaritima sediminicola]|uniref:C39 family peptidase n=1 Tax=Roseimaritima sediminicola TaxID=2662066 RepID=UPI001298530A|nr:C39 family peptidase [Roseimaritima sediminicola]
MRHALELEIQPQPTDSSCGPTCLAAVYQYWNDPVELNDLIEEVGRLGSGGTMAVQLACHGLSRGYRAVINTYNLQLFDPTWFAATGTAESDLLAAKLRQQLVSKGQRTDLDQDRLRVSTQSYLRFLSLGGQVQMRPLDEQLIVQSLTQGIPLLCGLSATYLYQECRERSHAVDRHGISSTQDDIAGEPTGHFVVLHGYDHHSGQVFIADPLHPNPLAPTGKYAAPLSQVAASIHLGILTYDANLLALTPSGEATEATNTPRAAPRR